MIETKITNTYAILEDNQSKVILVGRNEDNDSVPIKVTGMMPKFFAETEKVLDKESELIRQQAVEEIVHDTEREGWQGGDLSKVVVSGHHMQQKVAENNFDIGEIYESELYLRDELRVEEGVFSGVRAPSKECHVSELEPVEINDFRTRVCYIDIESDDRGEFSKDGSDTVLSIVAEDSFTGETVGFFHTGGRDVEDCFPNGRPDNLDRLEVVGSEAAMFSSFADYIEEHDPDMLTGWNFTDYDAPVIVGRMKFLDEQGTKKGIDCAPERLSREDYADLKRSGRAIIKGRDSYDLMEAWKRTKFTEPDVTALDDVAKMEIGAEKLAHTGMGYYQMWDEDPELLMEYNAQDVILCQRLNDETGILSFWSTLRDTVGVDWEDTRANHSFVEMLCRRKLAEEGRRGPAANYAREDHDYDGAFVFEPSTGVLKNVMGIDLASLYPNTMAMANLGSESKVRIDEESNFDTLEEKVEKLRKIGIDVAEAPINGGNDTAYFRLDEFATIPAATDDAIDLKKEAKRLRNDATPGTEEHDALSEEYSVKKTVTNSPYGVSGWEPFFLFDPEAAEGTTLLGQECIKATANFVRDETECTIAYGDTDSNYIKFPDDYSPEKCVKRTKEICERLNEEVYPELAEEFGIPTEQNRWRIEPEALSETFFQAGKKKRYAHKDIWDEGTWLDEPEYDITGFGSERSDSSALSEELQVDVIHAILDEKSDPEIGNLVQKAADRIDRNDPDWESIKVPGGFGMPFDQYEQETAHLRGYRYWSELTGAEMNNSGKPGRVYLDNPDLYSDKEEVDVISFEDFEECPEDVEQKLRVNVPKMTELTIKNPMETILGAVGIDVEAAIRGQLQTGLGAFC